MDKLTELTIRQAKPKSKQYKLFDGGGMFLLLHPNGSKYWRMKFNFEDKSKLASFGIWPEISFEHCIQKSSHRDVDAPEVQYITAVSHTRHSSALNKVGPIGLGRREGVGFMLKSRNEYFHDD